MKIPIVLALLLSAGMSIAQSSSDYAQTALGAHNIHRANHSASALTWNPLQAYIASFIASSCVFEHQPSIDGGNYGQNIAAFGTSSSPSSLSPSAVVARAVTDQWYNSELQKFLPWYYGEATPPMEDFENWGHFTQVVWKGTGSVGCASQFCPQGTIFQEFGGWFTVCNYVAIGNVEGEFGNNVGPPEGMQVVAI